MSVSGNVRASTQLVRARAAWLGIYRPDNYEDWTQNGNVSRAQRIRVHVMVICGQSYRCWCSQVSNSHEKYQSRLGLLLYNTIIVKRNLQ